MSGNVMKIESSISHIESSLWIACSCILLHAVHLDMHIHMQSSSYSYYTRLIDGRDPMEPSVDEAELLRQQVCMLDMIRFYFVHVHANK